jgi:hypothetical protein
MSSNKFMMQIMSEKSSDENPGDLLRSEEVKGAEPDPSDSM